MKVLDRGGDLAAASSHGAKSPEYRTLCEGESAVRAPIGNSTNPGYARRMATEIFAGGRCLSTPGEGSRVFRYAECSMSKLFCTRCWGGCRHGGSNPWRDGIHEEFEVERITDARVTGFEEPADQKLGLPGS